MTQREFMHKHPNGLNNTIYLFQKALYEVMTTEEFDRILKNVKDRKEKRWLKKFKKSWDKNSSTWKVTIWTMLGMIKSPNLFADVISLMVVNDKNVYKGENEE